MIFLNKKGGFTLIELLVVISIIGLLSSVVLASTASAREKARDAKRKQEIHQIDLAINLYKSANNGVAPSACSAGCNSNDSNLTEWNNFTTQLLTFMKTVPSGVGTIPYYYKSGVVSGDAGSYQISSALEGAGGQTGYSTTGTLVSGGGGNTNTTVYLQFQTDGSNTSVISGCNVNYQNTTGSTGNYSCTSGAQTLSAGTWTFTEGTTPHRYNSPTITNNNISLPNANQSTIIFNYISN